MMTPEDTALVLTSASSRGGVPSEKKRLPVPSRTGKTSSQISSASSCSSNTGASVELPQTIRCGPSIALTRRTRAPMSAPRPSAGPMPFLFGWNSSTRIRACQYEGCVLARSILEARDLNHAIQLVSQLPSFKHGLEPIDIRPAADLNELIKASEQRR